MGILQRIFATPAPQARMLSELAEITGRHQELANRLARHAGLCIYPNIAAGLRGLAARHVIRRYHQRRRKRQQRPISQQRPPADRFPEAKTATTNLSFFGDRLIGVSHGREKHRE
jgi:hypothetical protein